MKKVRYDRIALILIVVFLVVSAFLVYNNFNKNNTVNDNVDNNNLLDDNNNVVTFNSVVINGKVYDKNYLEREYNIIPDVLKQQVSFEDYIKSFFVPRTLLMLDAEKNNITVSDEEILKSLKDLNDTFLQQNTSVEEYIQSVGLTLDEFKNRLKQDLIVQKEVDFVTKNINVSDEEIRAVYESLNLSSKNITFEKAKNDLYNLILSDKKSKFLQTYIKQLENEYNVKFE